MQDGIPSLDIIIRDREGPSLTATVGFVGVDVMFALGHIIDPNGPGPIEAHVNATIDQGLLGAQFNTTGEVLLDLGDNGGETTLAYDLSPQALDDDYTLHVGKVTSEEHEFRVFAIEDPFWFLVGGVAVGVGVLVAWHRVKNEQRLRADADRKWENCIKQGGSPTWSIGLEDGIEPSIKGTIKISSKFTATVHCDMG